MEQLPFSAFEGDAQPAAAVAARRAFDRAMMPLYAGLGLSWLVLLATMPLVGLTLDPVLTIAFLVICGMCSWGAACLRLRGFARTATGIESWALFSAACLTGILGTYVAARCAAPYADEWMAAADRFIAPGLDWRTTMLALTPRPWLMAGANHAYASIQWQSSLLILLCCVTGQAERSAGFVLRWLIALALVCVVFVALPCLGPYAHYHIAQGEVPLVRSNSGWRQPELLTWLRGPGTLRLDPSALDGIVEFPSFHTAAGVLFAWGFWTIRWARWPMLALNLAMIAAAVPIGGHYYIDIVGGALVAWLAIVSPDWAKLARDRLTR